jgi:hypothetical protein
MPKRLRLIVAIFVIVVVFLTSEALIINFTAPVPSSNAIYNVEHSSSFQKETANATYNYLGYDNGRTSAIHCGPIVTGGIAVIRDFIHLFWPPANYKATTFIFAVQTNKTSNILPYPGGILYVQADPNSGQVYAMNFEPVCL